jgi:hypothetical protein
VILFDDVVEVLALAEAYRRRRDPSAFMASTAAGCAGSLSTFTTRGDGLPGDWKAFLKKRFAPAASRFAVKRKSIVSPVESTAR